MIRIDHLNEDKRDSDMEEKDTAKRESQVYKNRSLISQTLIINHLIIVHIYKCTHRHASICAHALGTGAYRYLPEIIDYIHLCTCVVVLVSKDMRAVLKLFLFINLLTVSV